MVLFTGQISNMTRSPGTAVKDKELPVACGDQYLVKEGRSTVSVWWARRDSNPHPLRDWNLNPARLPVSPLAHGAVHDTCRASAARTSTVVGARGAGRVAYVARDAG